MGYTFYEGYMDEMSDYEMRQEDDINEDIAIDNILDDPRRGQADYLNQGDY